MWPKRHRRRQPTEPLSPREQLWEDLRDFFQDDEGWRWAGGTVSFFDIEPEDVRRLWDHISAKATSFGDEPQIVGFDHEPPPDLPPLSEAVDRLILGEGISLVWPMLEGVQSHGEPLPDLFLELSSDSFGIYWWVGHPQDDWNPVTAAALAKLLGELRALVPNARLDLEHSDDPLELWGPIAAYLAAEQVRVSDDHA